MFTVSAYQSGVTINEQKCKAFGKLRFIYVKFTTSSQFTSWSHLINLGFSSDSSAFTNIFNTSTGKFLTDTLMYTDYGNSTLRNYNPLPAGTYTVTITLMSS